MSKIEKSAKKRIFEIIQIGEERDLLSRVFDFAVMFAILLHLACDIGRTYPTAAWLTATMDHMQKITAALFTIEYLLRLWTADYLYPKSRLPFLRYVFSLDGIIAVLILLPFYTPLPIPPGIIAFRIFRVMRILRLFRVNRYYDALHVIAEVLKGCKNQLLSSVFILFVLMMAASLLIYGVEHEAQPEVFRNAFSGFWWAASALLTVGYGDIYPITAAGKILGIILTFLGVGMVAIPTGILSAEFMQRHNAISAERGQVCPHCGRRLSSEVTVGRRKRPLDRD